MFFYLTNAALDISFAVCWWLLKTTGYVVYNGITYIMPRTKEKEAQNKKMNLDDTIIILDREELYDSLLRTKKTL